MSELNRFAKKENKGMPVLTSDGVPMSMGMLSHSMMGNTSLPASMLTPVQVPGSAPVVPLTPVQALPITAADRDRLLLEHLPTVRFVARRIHERLPQHIDMEDLISAGMVGLIDAFSKFDHGKQVQFKSYAQFRIRGAILDSLRTLDWSPRELRRKGRAVEETVRSLTAQMGRAPSEQEIAKGMELSLQDYQQLLGELKGLEIGSLNLERNEDGGDDELSYLPSTESDEPLFRCLKGEVRQHLIDAIAKLPEKERMVLSLYYYEELSMKEIGMTLGVVESRISQIHSAAVIRLRAAMADLGAEKSASKVRRPKSALLVRQVPQPRAGSLDVDNVRPR